MNIERIYADADLSRGLAAAALPTDTSEFDLVNTKLAELSAAKTVKLNALAPQEVPNIFAPQLEDATIKGFVDADTAMLTDGTLLRVSSPLQRYDTAELPHEYNGVLPEWAAKNLPSWMPGTGNIKKSDYASDKQLEQAALVKIKNIGDVTQQDVYDVGNRAQLQTVADLNLAKGQERQLIDMNSGSDIVDLSGKTSPLNLKVKIEKNRATVNGRQLSPLYNAETGENVTAMHANDPLMNAFAPGVPEPAQFSLKNVAKGAASGAVQVAGGLADTVISGAAYALKEAASIIGHPELYSAEDRDVAVKFLDKYKDSKWANELTGYDPKYNQAQLGKSLEAFKDGDFVGGIVNGAKAAPGVFADSIAYMAAVTTGVGTAGMIMSEINDSLEEFDRNNKRGITGADVARIAALDSAKVLLERLPFVHAIEGKAATVEAIKSLTKSMPEASRRIVVAEATKRAGLVGLNMAEEGLQEGAQGVIDYYNREYKTDVDNGLNTDEIYKSMIGGAGAGGLTGAIGQAKDVVSMTGVTDKLSKKKSATSTADTKAAELLGEEDVTDEERTHMAQVISNMEMDDYDFTTNTKDALDDFYRAEDTYRRLAAVSKNPEGVKTVGEALDKVRNRILSVVDNIDESKPFILKSSNSEFKLGNVEQDTSTTAKPNVEAAEALVEFVLENSPTLEAKRDAKLLKIATDNGMTVEKYSKLKSYYEVETEAVEGKRGYRGYERTLKALSAATSPNTKALNKAVKDAQGFWQSQINAVTEFEYGIKEAENRAAAANATGIAPSQVKVAAKQKVGSFEFTINYSSKPVNGKTVYSVHESAYNVLNAKKRNIVGIASALANVSKYIKEKKLDIDVGTSAGISVPAASKAEAQKYRDNDQKFYNRVGVTKVILDTTVPKTDGKVKKSSNDYKKWDKDYRSMNLSKINKDEYTKDDVVLINARTVVTKNGDKYKRKFADDKVAARVKEAMKAGATIVIDNDIIRKDQATYKNLVLLLGKFSSKEHKYSRVTTEDGKVQGAYIFKPEAQAKKINEEIKVKATAAKELKKIETKAKDELLLAVVDTRLNREGAAARLAEAKKAARVYFKDTDSGTVDDNMMKYANRVLDKEIDAAAVQLLEEIKQVLSGVELTDDNIQVYLNSREFAEIKLAEKVEGRKTISSKGIVELAEAKAKEYAMRAKDIRNMLQEWKQYTEEAKAGDTNLTLEQWLKTKHYEGKEAINLKDTISAGLGTVYVKLNDTKSFTKKAFGGESKGQALELDINSIVKVANTTVLNTIDIATIKDVSPQLASEIDTAVAKIQKILDLKKYTSEEKLKKGDGETELTAQEFALADSPGIALLLRKDGSINETAVAALVLSIHNAYKNSGYMLSTKTKSSEDLARMLGVRPEEINYKTAKAVSELGMLTKSLATDIRKDIAAKLGMTRNAEGIEDKRYDQAMTDLAQVAIAIGVENGVLKYDEMNIDKYEEDVLGMGKEEIAAHSQGRSPDVKVSFVKLVNDDVLKTGEVVDYDELVADLPMEDVYRQEPMFVKPSNKQIEARLEKVRNEKVGTKIPKKSKDLMTKGMKAEHTADVTRINDLLGEKYVDKIKKRMGWIDLDSTEYANLSQDKKDIQEAINRDVEKEINELLKLANKSNDGKSVKLWFMIDFIKNGRYMYDSNTINPQTQKQLTRWLVQPSDHTKTVTYTNGKFMVDGKDHTDAYMIALGQALGFPVDKKRLTSTKNHIEQLLPKLLDKDSTRLDTLFEEMLDNKAVMIDGLKVEIEHIAHAHQAIEMLKSIRDTGKATSALTAEIDAKTSGFGIKSALMPIIESITERLRAVGIDIGKEKSASKAITDYLDNGADSIKDMYQELGSTMTKKGLDINDSTTKSVIGKNITASSLTGIFSEIHNFLPNLDGGVPTEIRNLFKQPFMEFNYSAALRTIRKSLALEMAHQAAEAAMKDATKFKEMGFGKITGKTHAQFAAEMKVTNLNKMYYGTFKGPNNDLETRIAAALDLVYGTQVEAAFTKNFAAGIQAQGVINQAYQAMFKQYKKVYDNELAKLRQSNVGKAKGAVSAKQYKDLLKRLHRMFPTIRGPLASVETYDENTAIYSTVTATADSNESGAGPSHVAVNSAWSAKHDRQYKGKGISSSTLQYEIKQFEEAMSAGSVVPIHYFDGSLMAITGLSTDANLTMIHDAIMAPITEMFSVARSYNKAFYDLALSNKRYNIVEELQKSLERVTTEVAKYAKDNPSLNLMNGEIKVRLRKFDDKIGEKVEEQTVEFVEYIKTAAEELQKLRDSSDDAHAKLTEDIKKYGITVSNLVTGSDEGSYTRSGKAETKAKDATIAVNTAGEQVLNAELDKTATPLDNKYATLVAGIVNTVNKISVEKDSAIVFKYIANGIEKYIGGEYDPKNNTLKVAITPTMEQAFAAADGLTDNLYYRYIEDKQIADEDLNAYTNSDPYYTQLKESIPQVAQTLLEEASDIIRNSGLHSVTHEYVHAGAVRFMRDNPNHPASKRIVDIFTKVQHKRYDNKFAKAVLKDGYWKTNVNEFLAEALSNPKLMIALSTIKLTYSDRLASVLEWVVTAAMQMLGFKQKGSAYEFVMDGFAAIIEAQKAQNEVEMQDPTMIASKVVSKVEDDIINKVKAVGEELELRPALVDAALEKLKACKGQ